MMRSLAFLFEHLVPGAFPLTDRFDKFELHLPEVKEREFRLGVRRFPAERLPTSEPWLCGHNVGNGHPEDLRPSLRGRLDIFDHNRHLRQRCAAQCLRLFCHLLLLYCDNSNGMERSRQRRLGTSRSGRILFHTTLWHDTLWHRTQNNANGEKMELNIAR